MTSNMNAAELCEKLRLLFPDKHAGVDWIVDLDDDSNLRLRWPATGSGPTIEEVWNAVVVRTTAWTPSQFRDRFTNSELIAIHRKANTDDAICLLEISMFTAASIISNSESVINGMRLLVARNVLTQERADAILVTT